MLDCFKTQRATWIPYYKAQIDVLTELRDTLDERIEESRSAIVALEATAPRNGSNFR